MTLAAFKANVVNTNGDVVPSALITIRDSSGAIIPPAQIFTDFNIAGPTIPSNPYNTDALGQIEFYILPQRVSVKAQDGAVDVDEWNNIILNAQVATAGYLATGTAAGELPTNADLGSASLLDTGAAAGELPTNGDLGTAAQADIP